MEGESDVLKFLMSTFVDVTLCMQCTEKIVSVRLLTGSVSAERVGQGEVGGVTRRVTCTCWLLWLSVEMPWLALGGPILALFAQIGLENTALTL